MPEFRESKLNSHTGMGLYVELSHPETISEVTQPSCKTMKVFGRFWKKFKFCCKNGYMMQYC